MIYGYARVSTKGQARDGNSLEAQTSALTEAGAEKIYYDSYTGTTTDRPEFDKLKDILSPGDKLLITKLDRFARTVAQGSLLIESLIEKGVTVHVLNIGIMDNTPTGKLIRNIMLSFAEFERGQEEALKAVNVGDTITFEGECLSAGTWVDCEIVTE